jgi:hypothetical protein
MYNPIHHHTQHRYRTDYNYLYHFYNYPTNTIPLQKHLHIQNRHYVSYPSRLEHINKPTGQTIQAALHNAVHQRTSSHDERSKISTQTQTVITTKRKQENLSVQAIEQETNDFALLVRNRPMRSTEKPSSSEPITTLMTTTPYTTTTFPAVTKIKTTTSTTITPVTTTKTTPTAKTSNKEIEFAEEVSEYQTLLDQLEDTFSSMCNISFVGDLCQNRIHIKY